MDVAGAGDAGATWWAWVLDVAIRSGRESAGFLAFSEATSDATFSVGITVFAGCGRTVCATVTAFWVGLGSGCVSRVISSADGPAVSGSADAACVVVCGFVGGGVGCGCADTL